MTHKNFASIEGLRAWMAWWVVIGHGIQLTGSPTWLSKNVAEVLMRGETAVNVFIIISGFVITHLLLARQEPYSAYISKRFFRLAPVYFLCIGLAIWSEFAYRYAYLELPYALYAETRIDRLEQTNANFAWHMLAHLSMLHGAVPDNILPYADVSLLVPAWSLSLEWQFYLVAPALIYFLRANGKQYLLGMTLCLSLFVLSKIFAESYFQKPSMLFLSLHFFLAGITTRIVLSKQLTARKTIACFCFIFLFLFCRWHVEAVLWGIWCLFILRDAGLPLGRLSAPLSSISRLVAENRIITSLGRWSYSTYLVHIPLFSILLFVSVKIFGLSDSRHSVQIILLFGCIVLVPLSFFMYKFIEIPGIRFGKQFQRHLGDRV